METHSSRCLIVDKLLKSHRWINGPDFLYLPQEQWPKTEMDDSMLTLDGDPEVKRKIQACAASTERETEVIERMLTYFSSWYRLR